MMTAYQEATFPVVESLISIDNVVEKEIMKATQRYLLHNLRQNNNHCFEKYNHQPAPSVRANKLCNYLTSEKFHQSICEGLGLSPDDFDPSPISSGPIKIVTPTQTPDISERMTNKNVEDTEEAQQIMPSFVMPVSQDTQDIVQLEAEALINTATLGGYMQRESKPVTNSYTPQLASLGQNDMSHIGFHTHEVAANKINCKGGSLAHRSDILPSYFKPGPYSIIIGRGKESKGVIGNLRLRILASTFLTRYSNAPNKAAKSKIVATIVSMVREACPLGAFIRLGKDGRWYDVKEAVATEKVGYTMRELLGDRYKSSSKTKAKLRRCVGAVNDDDASCSSTSDCSTSHNDMNQHEDDVSMDRR